MPNTDGRHWEKMGRDEISEKWKENEEGAGQTVNQAEFRISRRC